MGCGNGELFFREPLEAFREVEDSLIAYQKFRFMRTQKEKLVELNRHAVELSEARDEEGLATTFTSLIPNESYSRRNLI